ncbi:MAG: MATE family efflux transporter [Lachnospiraceae bacterium]|nr:MATE family efflux transporter [Lachnospiraceae bacterium]
MLSNLLQVLFNMADIAVVGRFAGSAPLGSVGSTTNLVVMLTGFLVGMGGGVNALVARFFGAEDKSAVSQTVHTAFIICLLTGIVVTIGGIAVSNPMLTLLNTKPELIDGALLYLRIYVLGAPALAMFNYGNAIFSAVGNTKKPLIYLFLSGVINILLNLFFVIFFNMDVEGVALASIISQYISALLVLRALIKTNDIFALRLSKISFNKDKAVSIVAIGIPSGLQMAVFQVSNLFIQTSINSFSAITVAGNSAAGNADSITYNIIASFYTACSSFIGQNYGAGKKERIKKTYGLCFAFSFLTAACLGVAILALGPQFLGLFNKEADVIAAGMKRLSMIMPAIAFSSLTDTAMAASRGLGKTTVPTIILLMGSCIFRIVWVVTIFAHFGTIESLYLLYFFSWTITGIFQIAYFKLIYKKQTAIFG